MQKKVIAAIEQYGMLKNVTEVTVALSGGADSVALLHCLLSLKSTYGIKVYALHLNHNLRGSESDRDEAFVRDLCKKWEVPLKVESADINKESSESGESTELAARRVRYAFFEKKCNGVVATAHTASDSAETVLFNLTRGTALSGLCGIPPIRDIYIRPLIFCTRQNVEEYCRVNNLEFVNDSTNFTDEYTRNKIRHNIVPVLREINPSFESAVGRMTCFLKEDEDFINSIAKTEFLKSLSGDTLKTDAIKEMHPAVAKRILKLYVWQTFNAELDSTNLELLFKTVKGEVGATVLPSGIKATLKNGNLCLKTYEEKPNFHYKTEIVKENIEKINNLLLKDTLDCGKIVGELVVRNREPSDKMRLANRGVTKSLKKLFNELKVPEAERQLIPVISDDKGVVWIYNVGVSERVKVDNTTKEVCVIKAEKIFD